MSRERKLRPAHQEPKGYYGNEHIKQSNGGIVTAPASMKLPTKTPCRECPLRRDSASGYLGGYSPEMYIEVLHSPASLACHCSPGFHEGDIASQRQCTGVAAYRANVGHIAQIGGRTTNAHEATKFIGHDEEVYFSSPEEFVAHHAPGQKRKT